jgi:hypothetical protein
MLFNCMDSEQRTEPFYTPGYYRAQAEYCRQQAERAGDEMGVRQTYLDLAEKWESVARHAETSQRWETG